MCLGSIEKFNFCGIAVRCDEPGVRVHYTPLEVEVCCVECGKIFCQQHADDVVEFICVRCRGARVKGGGDGVTE